MAEILKRHIESCNAFVDRHRVAKSKKLPLQNPFHNNWGESSPIIIVMFSIMVWYILQYIM